MDGPYRYIIRPVIPLNIARYTKVAKIFNITYMSIASAEDDKLKQEIITLELPRETVRKLDFIIRFCNIIPQPNQNQSQYSAEELQPAIVEIRRQIYNKLFPPDEED